MDDATLLRLLDAAFDFVCERRVNEILDPEWLMTALDRATEPPRLSRWLEHLGAPAGARALARLRSSSLPLGDWLPPPVREALAELLGRPMPLPRPLVDQVLADEHLRESARAMLQETMSSFVDKAFAAAPGGRGLRGMIGLGAKAAGGLFGGLGEELQRQLQGRVRDFVDGRMTVLQGRVAEELVSVETARMLGRRRRELFSKLLRRPESDAARLADRLPGRALLAMLPAIVQHNLAREAVRRALREELAAALDTLARQPIGALFDELGLRELVRQRLQAQGLPWLRAFLASTELLQARIAAG